MAKKRDAKETKAAKPSKKGKKVVAEEDEEAEAPKAKKGKKGKGDATAVFDYGSLYNDDLDVIARRQGVEVSSLDIGDPMSTGLLMYDLLLGGGIRAGMYTEAGWEQSAKTTKALNTMAAAIKQSIPLIEWWDYEGCVVADTYLGYGKGKVARLKDLFDLSNVKNWTPGTWVGQARTDIDTFEPGHRYGGTGVRSGSLYYKGKCATTKVTFNTGHHLVGHGHKMFVLQNGMVSIKKLEDLVVGEQVLVSKSFLPPVEEVWKPVVGFGPIISKRYEVSNLGNVRSKDFVHVVSRLDPRSGKTINTKRTVKGRVLKPNAVKDGHVWVSLCDGQTQNKQLVHRLVARAFIGKAPAGKPLVLHWNDNPSDNRVSNLRYGSNADNSADKVRRGRCAKGEAAPTAKLAESDISRIKALRNRGWALQRIADKFNVSNATVYQVCAGNSWQHLGEEAKPFDITAEINKDYEVAAVVSIEKTGKKEHVFDVSLRGVAQDELPHSIITNGIVTHNSTKNSKKYVNAIVRGMGVKLEKYGLFGKRDDATGKWLVRPRVRYHAETVGDKFFDYMSEVLRKLPDKKFIAKRWWLRFDETKEHKAKYGHLGDTSMNKKYGKGIWIPAPDGNLQGIFFTDSYPAMNPAANDEEDANNGLGLQARMFSKHLPRVKGRLAEKMVALIGINQMRDVPMAMFGPKEQEPGGKALRFNSDVRSRNTARSSGMPLWPKNFNDAKEETEKSVEFKDTKDRYRYIETKMIKNKLWTPGRRGWFRIWIEDGSGTARGFCPFFDTMVYLRETGQLQGKGRDKLTLVLDGIGKAKPLSWYDYKQWVLGDKDTMVKISKKAGFKPMSLRAYCFKQMASGKGEELYVANKGDGSEEE